jgi:hypothetical protein
MIAGQVMRNNGRLVRAHELLTTCAADACTEEADKECEDIRVYCLAKAEDVKREVPSVVVRVTDDRALVIGDATVRIDSSAVDITKPIALDPGRHVVRAAFAARTRTIDFEAHAHDQNMPLTLAIDLRERVPARPVPWYTIALAITSGVAAASAASFGIATQTQANALSFCYPGSCDPSREGLFLGTAIATDVSLGVLAAAALATLVTYLVRPTVFRTVHIETSAR